MMKGTDLTVGRAKELYGCICYAARARPPKKAQIMTEKNSDLKEGC